MIKSPSFIFFLAGIAAAAGTTFITSIPAVRESPERAFHLILCSIPWLFLSWLLAKLGTVVEDGRRRVDLLVSPLMKPNEMNEIEKEELARLSPAMKRLLWWSATAFVAEIAALWMFV
jgi:hypothetical protein